MRAGGFYALPFKGNRAISGWEISVISSAQSGNPLQPIVALPVPIFNGVNLRPNVSGSLGVTGRYTHWFCGPCRFHSACDATLTICSPGDMGRNPGRRAEFCRYGFVLDQEHEDLGED